MPSSFNKNHIFKTSISALSGVRTWSQKKFLIMRYKYKPRLVRILIFQHRAVHNYQIYVFYIYFFLIYCTSEKSQMDTTAAWDVMEQLLNDDKRDGFLFALFLFLLFTIISLFFCFYYQTLLNFPCWQVVLWSSNDHLLVSLLRFKSSRMYWEDYFYFNIFKSIYVLLLHLNI